MRKESCGTHVVPGANSRWNSSSCQLLLSVVKRFLLFLAQHIAYDALTLVEVAQCGTT